MAAPVPTTFNFSVFKLTVPLFVPSVTPRLVDKLATASVAIVLTSPMLATLLLSALLLATIPVPTLVMALLPALMPLVPSIETVPTVTLLVVIPVDPIVVLPPIVAASNVTFLAVAILNVLPVWVIAILSPSLKATVSPPLTSSAAVELAFTLKDDASLAASLMACSLTVKVMSLPDAAVEINLLSPFTDNVSFLRFTAELATVVSPPILRFWLLVTLFTAFETVVLTISATLSVVATPLVVDLAVPSALLPKTPCLTETVTVSPAADVEVKLPSPATLNAKPPDLLRS